VSTPRPDPITETDAILNRITTRTDGLLAGLTDDPLERELITWRAAVHADPVPELVDVLTARRIIWRTRMRHRLRVGALRWALFAWIFILGVLLLWWLTGCQTPKGAPSSPPPAVESFAYTTPALLVLPPSNHVTGSYPPHCARGAGEDPRLPVQACTPGSVRADITQDNIGTTICNRNWSTDSIRAPKTETDRLKTTAMRAYDVPASARGTTELDHDVSLWLGGSNDVTNLWPELSDQPGRGFHNSKDDVETRLHTAVCGHQVLLRDAQVALAANWVTAEVVLGLPPR
jgi:hypothetical protein